MEKVEATTITTTTTTHQADAGEDELSMEGGLAPHVLPSPQLCVNPTTKQIELFRYENMEITTKISNR